MRLSKQKILGVNVMLALAVLIMMLVVPTKATASESISGIGVDGLSWVLEDGVLTISGNGDMYDGYSEWGIKSPWFDYSDMISKVVVEEGVTSVGYGAFSKCVNVTSVTLPAGLTNISLGSFEGCTGLSGVWVHEDNQYYCSDASGVLFDKDKTQLILLPAMLSGNYRIPEGITTIGEYALSDAAHLTSIWIPASVSELSYNVFSGGSSLMQILVDDDHPTFGNDLQGALLNKDQTVLIAVPAGVTGTYTIQDGITEVCQSAFNGCGEMTAVVIPPSLKTVGGYGMFDGCDKLNAIHISDVKAWCEIGSGYWSNPLTWGCKLYLNGEQLIGELVIPEGTTRIGFAAFYGCAGITGLEIPESVKVIDECAFLGCTGLTELEIPSGVEKLIFQAFYDCTALKEVTIAETVTEIQSVVFSGCTNLQRITFKGDAPEFSSDAFMGNTFTAYYPYGNETWNDETMLDYGGSVTWVPYSNAPANVKQWSLSLGDDIGVNFYADVDDSVAAEAVLRITVDGKVTEYAVADIIPGSDGLRAFTAEVAAAQMTKTITVELIVSEEITALGEYSVLEYADHILTDEESQFTDVQKALVKAMLVYGGAAQAYFGYNTDAPANDGVSVEAAEVPVESPEVGVSGKISGISYYGATLVFESKTAVRFYFDVTGDIGGYTFTAGENTYEPVKKGDRCYVEIPDINPQDLDEEIELAVSDGTDTFTVTYSPMHYIVRMYNGNSSDSLKALLQAMYGYYLAAEAFVAA